MIKILVVDDEVLARQKVLRYLHESSKIGEFSIYEAQNGLEAVEKIQAITPDLVFLDIQMPGFNGFEVLQNCGNNNFKIIFQTAYDEYAVKAFDINACDYLLKPYTLERFQVALSKALNAGQYESKNKALESNLIHDKKFLNKLSVKKGSAWVIVETQTIHYFISKDHYTLFYSNQSEHITHLSLDKLEKQLNPEEFMRIHRNNIVKISAIKKVQSGENMIVELTDGTLLPVSRQNRSTLKNKLSI